MTHDCDVVIVGARCAGAPLAVHLAKAGLRTVLVDRAEFPSETLSTHIFQVEGILALQRLGVLDAVLATGAPPLNVIVLKIENMAVERRPRLRPGDPFASLGVRRTALDTVLVDAAATAGADVRAGTTVRSLVEEEGRVVGVEVQVNGKTDRLRAPLVVGADGRTSTVARLVGARRYHQTPSPRVFVWGYFDGACLDGADRAHFKRVGDSAALAFPTDGGAYCAAMSYGNERKPELFGLPDHGFASVLPTFPEVEAIVGSGRLIDGWRVVTRYDGFMRESAGPGWVLVGDAGHFKDPTPGQGISDAFRQAEALAAAVVRGLGSGNLDQELQAWWQWRDEDAIEKHWFASDLGVAGELPPLVVEMLSRVMGDDERLDDLLDVFAHRARPSKVLSPKLLLTSAASLLRRGGRRRQTLADARALMATTIARQRLQRRPDYTGATVSE